MDQVWACVSKVSQNESPLPWEASSLTKPPGGCVAATATSSRSIVEINRDGEKLLRPRRACRRRRGARCAKSAGAVAGAAGWLAAQGARLAVQPPSPAPLVRALGPAGEGDPPIPVRTDCADLDGRNLRRGLPERHGLPELLPLLPRRSSGPMYASGSTLHV